MSSVSLNYERKVYGLNDMLGNVGGIYGILQAAAGIIAFFFTKTNIETQYVSIFTDKDI
jgi:hypothetical protein